MSDALPTEPRHALWSVSDIPYGSIDRDRIQHLEYCLYGLAAASFVEITSDIYTGNLVEHFRDDAEAVSWLQQHWQHEEVQHGHALKRYVQTVWPDFPWEETYRRFFDEYSELCTTELLEQNRALEFVARCVVETGTASLYRMLAEFSPEPVLRELAARIMADEVRHYKFFYHFYRRHREREGASSLAVARTLWRRVVDLKQEDIYYAFKHAYLAENPDEAFDYRAYHRFLEWAQTLARDHYPFDMAVKMFLKPLELRPSLCRATYPIISNVARSITAFQTTPRRQKILPTLTSLGRSRSRSRV